MPHTMEVRSHGYTDWITVDAIPENPGICFASLLYWYVRASEAMPKGVRDDHLFCSMKALKTNGGRYHGLVSTSLANIMKRLMKAAKIPDEFLPHSARAVGMAQGKATGMTDGEVCTRSNVSRPTYIKYYQRQIRTKAYHAIGRHDEPALVHVSSNSPTFGTTPRFQLRQSSAFTAALSYRC